MEEIIYKIYQKIGDYFTGKRKPIFALLLVGFILSILLSCRYQIIIPENILISIFSGVFQSLVALVALLIVASIFKLQILHNREEKICDEMRLSSPDFVYHTGRFNEAMTLEEIIEEIKKIEQKDQPIPRRLREVKEIAEEILLSRSLIKDFILKFTVYTFFVVIISLICLIIVHFVSVYYLGVSIIYLVSILFTYSLFLVIKGIVESLW